MRLQDSIDSTILRRAVDIAMERYPYFCVKLLTRDAGFIFAENRKPVVISAVWQDCIFMHRKAYELFCALISSRRYMRHRLIKAWSEVLFWKRSLPAIRAPW